MKGIVFTGPHVLEIERDRKTQTRRVWSNPDSFGCTTGDCPHDLQAECDAAMRMQSPYGVPGDVLYVKEAWASVTIRRDLPGDPIYEAPPVRGACEVLYRVRDDDGLTEQGFCWRSPRFMPRWAARLFVRITDVRAQRLQDISEADAIAEGCSPSGWFPTYADPDNVTGAEIAPAVEAYAALWDSINAKRSPWARNPWVWAITFERIEGTL